MIRQLSPGDTVYDVSGLRGTVLAYDSWPSDRVRVRFQGDEEVRRSHPADLSIPVDGGPPLPVQSPNHAALLRDLDARFAARPPLDSSAVESIRLAAKSLALLMVESCPEGPQLLAALNLLDAAVTQADAAIAGYV